MNTKQKHLLSFVRRMNLNMLMFGELEDQDSPLVKFINSFTLNYIVKNLDQVKRQDFVNLLEQENGDEKIWQFVKKNIKNFEESYEKELENKLRKIRNQTLNIQKKL